MDEPRTWEKREAGETDSAWSAFLLFRDAGPSRSLQRTATDGNRALSTVEKYSSRFKWAARSAAFDACESATRRQAAEREMARTGVEDAQVARVRAQAIADAADHHSKECRFIFSSLVKAYQDYQADCRKAGKPPDVAIMAGYVRALSVAEPIGAKGVLILLTGQFPGVMPLIGNRPADVPEAGPIVAVPDAGHRAAAALEAYNAAVPAVPPEDAEK